MGLQQSAFRTPRSAAFAGMIFALLTLASLVTIHLALPSVPADSADLLTTSPRRDLLLAGLSLVPFAAVAFLWFVGVVRDRIGEREDRFFSTVFLGSGLLFLASLFAATAVAGGLVTSYATAAPSPDVWNFGREATYAAMNVYAVKMAGV